MACWGFFQFRWDVCLFAKNRFFEVVKGSYLIFAWNIIILLLTLTPMADTMVKASQIYQKYPAASRICFHAAILLEMASCFLIWVHICPCLFRKHYDKIFGWSLEFLIFIEAMMNIGYIFYYICTAQDYMNVYSFFFLLILYLILGIIFIYRIYYIHVMISYLEFMFPTPVIPEPHESASGLSVAGVAGVASTSNESADIISLPRRLKSDTSSSEGMEMTERPPRKTERTVVVDVHRPNTSSPSSVDTAF